MKHKKVNSIYKSLKYIEQFTLNHNDIFKIWKLTN